MAHKRKDILWKAIIEDFPIDFVTFFHKDATAIFNFNIPIEFMDKELQQIAPDWEFMDDAMMVDKLMKLASASPIFSSILLLTELQCNVDKGFTERLFTYFTRLLDKYGWRVMVLVIYADTNKLFRPSFANYDLEDTHCRLDFKTYKVLDQDEVLLATDKNVMGLIILTVFHAIKHQINHNDEELLAAKIMLVKNLKNRHLSAKQESKLLTFIQLYASFVNPKMNLKFEQELHLLTNKITTMGMFEAALEIARYEVAEEVAEAALSKGIEQGKIEKNCSVVKNLLSKGKLTIEEICDVSEVSLDFVLGIKRQLG